MESPRLVVEEYEARAAFGKVEKAAARFGGVAVPVGQDPALGQRMIDLVQMRAGTVRMAVDHAADTGLRERRGHDLRA